MLYYFRVCFKSLFKISPHTSWRRIFRPDFVKNPCNPPGLRRLFALLDKKSPRQSPHAEILNRLLEAVPIGAGTHLDGKFFVWLRQKLLKSVRIPASFFLARQKIFLANMHTVTYWYNFLKLNGIFQIIHCGSASIKTGNRAPFISCRSPLSPAWQPQTAPAGQ